MLSADVPEFVPKAQRDRAPLESNGADCDVEEQIETSSPNIEDIPPPTTSQNEDESVEVPRTVGDAVHRNVTDNTVDNTDAATVAQGSIPGAEALNPDEVDCSLSHVNGAASLTMVSSCDINHVIENKYPHSKLSATVAEFIPASVVYINSNSTESPSPHNPFSPATGPAYVYPAPYGYYPPWTPELDYSSGYYNSMPNNGHYSGGELFVPDGGFVYDGTETYSLPGAGMVMDPIYYDSGMMGIDYGGGAMAYNAYSGFSGRGGKSNTNFSRRPFNSNNKNKGRKFESTRGGARGGGGRQPSTEIGICSQTGEMTVGKRKPNQAPQTKSDANGWSSRSHVHASNILGNANNWPSLATGKPDQSIAAPVELPRQQESSPPLPAEPLLPVAQSNSFSSIARKKSGNGESISEKPRKEAKCIPNPKNQTPAKATCNVTETPSFNGDNSAASLVEAASSISCNGPISSSDDGNGEKIITKSDSRDPESSEAAENGSLLSKSAKKKAKKKQKKLKEAKDQISQQFNLETSSKTPAQDVEPSATKTSTNEVVSHPPSMAEVLSNRSKHGKMAANGTAPSKINHAPVKEPCRTKEVPVVAKTVDTPINNTEISTVTAEENVTVNNLAEVDTATEPIEDEWITVSKRSKSKKSQLAKAERTGALGFRQSRNSVGNNTNFRQQNSNSNGVNFRASHYSVERDHYNRRNSNIEDKGENFRGSQQIKLTNSEHRLDETERPASERLNLPDKVSSEVYDINSKSTTEINGSVSVSSPDKVAAVAPSEAKSKDKNDPETQEILKRRALKKEKAKQEKKIMRENTALQKQTNARKDSKLSVVPTAAEKTCSNPKNLHTGTFVMNSEEYPTLGVGVSKKSKPSPDSSTKIELKNLNGIIQSSPKNVPVSTSAWTNASNLVDELNSSVGEMNSAMNGSTEFKISRQPSRSDVKPASALGDSSVRRKVKNGQMLNSDDSSKVRSQENKGKRSTGPAPSKHVKSSHKITLSLDALIKSSSQRGKTAVRRPLAVRTMEPLRRPAASSSSSKPTRLVDGASAGLREKGKKKKSLTPAQRYRKIRAQYREKLLMLSEIQRIREGGEPADVNTEGFREDSPGAAATDGWTDVDEVGCVVKTAGDEAAGLVKVDADEAASSVTTDVKPTLKSLSVADKLLDEILFYSQKKTCPALDAYVKNVITPELNSNLELMLSDLVRFQRRQYATEPIKAKAKRRYICGIKETTKKMEKIRLLVVAPDPDMWKSSPVVVESLSVLLQRAESLQIPVIFGLSRTKLARSLASCSDAAHVRENAAAKNHTLSRGKNGIAKNCNAADSSTLVSQKILDILRKEAESS
ncbi:hypothetical protein HAZT_HAZT004307 [Hyalella azteca]|uniref:Ribosomal protein L7Ae/L30e/S12e/Gadd45 domain-containing protein n=1 Tax=Hyalella azteca TaxID=294128 RepID=A0A6A0H249_HYAAZ|nr:hypothetical protein HAZT_HAZT004307 [Hyalella azteca]